MTRRNQPTPDNTEASEAEAMYLMLAAVREPERSILGTSATRFAGGVVLSMANDPVDYWSKALGFGYTDPIGGDLVKRIVDTFRAAGAASATIQLAPHLLPADWPDICSAHGLTAESTWVKLVGPAHPIAAPASELRTARVLPADVEEWANVIFTGFGMPPQHLPSLLVGAASSPKTIPFASWDGDTMVAGASLVMHGDIGHLAGAATLPAHRGRGAQGLLIAARADAAGRAGVRRLYAETGKPDRPGSNSSLNNLVRAGLTPLYDRINWRWTAAADTSARGAATPTP